MSTAEMTPAPTVTTDRQNLLDRIVERQADIASRYKPVMDNQESIQRFRELAEYIKNGLVEGEDYGRVPGVEKPFLFKAGAQKLCTHFGYVPHYTALTEIEDWSGAEHGGEPLFYYKYCCTLYRNADAVGEGIGSANSWESKYRYRWVGEDVAKMRDDWEDLPTRSSAVSEFAFAIDKAETGGTYGKPKDYWAKWHAAIENGEAVRTKRKTKTGKEMDAWEMGGMAYRVPNDQFPDVINTCQKQGEKRAYVEATLSATGASQFFSQDEDAVAVMLDGPVPATKQPAQEVRNVPPEIEALFREPVPAGCAGAAFALVKAALSEALPQNGHDEYQRILEHNGIKAKGNTIAQSRNAVMQCWTLAQSAKKARKQTADLGVNMSDMPEGQGRELPIEEEPAQ